MNPYTTEDQKQAIIHYAQRIEKVAEIMASMARVGDEIMVYGTLQRLARVECLVDELRQVLTQEGTE